MNIKPAQLNGIFRACLLCVLGARSSVAMSPYFPNINDWMCRTSTVAVADVIDAASCAPTEDGCDANRVGSMRITIRDVIAVADPEDKPDDKTSFAKGATLTVTGVTVDNSTCWACGSEMGVHVRPPTGKPLTAAELRTLFQGRHFIFVISFQEDGGSRDAQIYDLRDRDSLVHKIGYSSSPLPEGWNRHQCPHLLLHTPGKS
jgi:hypothetical protein